MQKVLSHLTVSMSDMKRNPAEVLRNAGDDPVAVLNHNKTAFYMVPPNLMEALLDEIEDARIELIAASRLSGIDSAVEVSLDDL